MNKLNLPPFYVGQKVVYITGINMPKNSIHTISEIVKKPCGCCIGIRINNEPFIPTSGFFSNIRCVNCGNIYPRALDTGELWNPESFRPLQQQKFPLMTFSKIVEKEKEEILINN